jgi:hypothetical protein
MVWDACYRIRVRRLSRQAIAAQEKSMLRIGISEVDITPAPGLRMAGMVNPPEAKGVHFPLMGRTVVFDDGIRCAALVGLDLLLLIAATVSELRQALSAGTRLAPSDILITCNHTHRAPYTAALMNDDPDFAYLDLLRERLVKGMAAAWAAREVATIRSGSVEQPGWTYNRRQIYWTEMGEQVGTQGPEWIDEFVRREGPEDNEIGALLFERPDGSAVGGMVNFACHTTVMGGERVYSADYSGPLCDELSQHFDAVFAFLQGASGNLWAVDRSRKRPPPATGRGVWESGPEHAHRMAGELAQGAIRALENGRSVAGEVARVRVGSQVLAIPQRRPTAEQVVLAKWFLEQAPQDVDLADFTRRIYGHPFAFYGHSRAVEEWFAREMLGMWEWQRRAGTRELVEEVEVQVIAVGDLAFAGFPAEYFTEFGLEVKRASPFADTRVVQLANGWHGYVPTREAFDHGGYEARFAYQSRLVPEAGDAMCDAALQLLHGLAR